MYKAEDLVNKTDLEIEKIGIDLIKILYNRRPKNGFKLESGTTIRDFEIFFKSYKGYFEKHSNFRLKSTNEINPDLIKWINNLEKLKTQTIIKK